MDTNQILEQARTKGGERFHTEGALHLTADGRAVNETDPAGRFVLVGPGGDIPLPLAQELGLLNAPAEEVTPEAPEPHSDPPELELAEETPQNSEVITEAEAQESAEEDAPEEKAATVGTVKAVHKAQVSDKAVHKAQAHNK